MAHWLEGVLSILEADTGDLRKLAQVCGADPATFYIGAPMDGADLRGQDLRGMAFTDLRIAKVKVDHATRLDPEQWPLEESETSDDGRTLLAIADPQLQPPKSILEDHTIRVITDNPSLYNLDEQGFVAFLLDDRLPSIPSAPTASGAGPVGLAVRTAGPGPLTASERSARLRFDGPVVVIQSSGPVFSMRDRPALPADCRDAVHLLRRLGRPDNQSGEYYFVRAAGVGPEPVADAWCQLYGRLMRLGAPPASGVRVTTNQERRLRKAFGAEVGAILFPGLETAGALATEPSRRPAVAAALVGHWDRWDELDWRRYGEAVQRVAQARGWRISEAASPTQFNLASPAARRTYRCSVTNFSASRVRENMVAGLLPEVHLSEVNQLIFAENVSLGRMLELLVTHRALVVSLRDLVSFDPEEPEIWSLLASIMRRHTSGLRSRTRTPFLWLLLHHAAMLEQLDVSDRAREALHAFLSDDSARLRSSLSWSANREDLARGRFLVQISDAYGAPTALDRRFYLSFSQIGPVVTARQEELPFDPGSPAA